MIDIQCPHCDAVISYADKLPGADGTYEQECPFCHKAYNIRLVNNTPGSWKPPHVHFDTKGTGI